MVVKPDRIVATVVCGVFYTAAQLKRADYRRQRDTGHADKPVKAAARVGVALASVCCNCNLGL